MSVDDVNRRPVPVQINGQAFVVTGKQRFPGAPEIPTATEAGLPGFELEFWIGMLAPARTPPAIVAKLHTLEQRHAAIAEEILARARAHFDELRGGS